jgi:hypothetical protein
LVTKDDIELKETFFDATKKSNGINGYSEYNNIDLGKTDGEDEKKSP